MGCSSSHTPPPVKLDPRLPFTNINDLHDLKYFWDFVKRRFEETAMENLIRFFRLNPQFQMLFKDLLDLQDELDMRSSTSFEYHALSIFHVFDDVIENMENDMDGVTLMLEDLAKVHARIDGFQSEYFQEMEDPFIEALRDKFYEKLGDHEEHLLRTLYQWMISVMKLEVEAIHYRLIPGE